MKRFTYAVLIVGAVLIAGLGYPVLAATTFYDVQNFTQGSLDSGIDDTTTTVVLETGDGVAFPSGDPDFLVSIDTEVLLVTSRSGDTLTVQRGFNGTTEASHDTGATVSMNFTAAHAEQMQTAINALENIDTEAELEDSLIGDPNIYTENDGPFVQDIADLGDVTITSPADTEVLTYNSGLGVWENQASGGDDLGDVDTEAELQAALTDVTDVFTNNDGALDDDDLTDDSIDELSDVSSTTPSAAQMLVVNNSNVYQNRTLSGDATISATGVVDIANDAVDSTELAANAVDNTAMADSAINTNELVDAAVTNAKLGLNSVESDNIVNGTIAVADMASNSVGTSQIINGNVTSADIQDSTVASVDIADGAVTNGKIGANAVTSAKVQDGTITSADIANETIVSADIDDDSISYDDIDTSEWVEIASANSISSGDYTLVGGPGVRLLVFTTGSSGKTLDTINGGINGQRLTIVRPPGLYPTLTVAGAGGNIVMDENETAISFDTDGHSSITMIFYSDGFNDYWYVESWVERIV